MIPSLLLAVFTHGFPTRRFSRPTMTPLHAEREFGIKILSSIKEFRREEWNALLTDKSSPFLEYDWIYGITPLHPIIHYIIYTLIPYHIPFYHPYQPFTIAMEESGCATAEEGWQPVHIGVYEQLPESSLKSMETPPPLGALMAVCPLYVKYNSMGEFIFDHSWADYAQRVLVRLFVLKDNLSFIYSFFYPSLHAVRE